MRFAAPNLMALVAAALVALPPGWCCRLVSARGCMPAETAKAAAAPQPLSCCHHKPVQKQPSPCAPQSPAKPGQMLCCFPQPTVPQKTSWQAPDLAMLPFEQPVVLALGTLSPSLPEPAWFVVNSPPLNLLHCVWLC